MHGGREIEIKLELDPAAIAKLAAYPAFRRSGSNRPRVQALRSIYYDTDDRRLWKAGLSLRLRYDGEGWIETVKAEDGATAGLFDRPEWERPAAGELPGADAARGSPAEPIVAGQRLKPVFEVNVTRTSSQILDKAAEIELALDQGAISADGLSEPVVELELELKRGDSIRLFELLEDLAKVAPVALATASKARRGFQLVNGRSAGPATAEAIPLIGEETAADAFRMIARECLRQITANRPGVAGGDYAAIHQMRIGIRRLRAALTIFGKMVWDDRRAELCDELRWLAGELAPARELDVFLSNILLPLLRERPSDIELLRRQRSIKAERAAAYNRAAAAVASDRFRQLGLDILTWVEVGPWSIDEAGEKARGTRIDRFASRAIVRRRKKVDAAATSIREMTPETRHRLRIKVKKLRYLMEFLNRLFARPKQRKRAAKNLEALKELQDALGDLNDVEARKNRGPATHNGKAGTSQQNAHAEGLIAGYFDARKELLLAVSEKAVAKFMATKALRD